MQRPIDTEPIRYSATTIAQSVGWYERQMYRSLQICQSIAPERVSPNDLVLRRRTTFLRNQLATRDYGWQDYEESVLRGTLLEIVSQEAFSRIAQQTASYEVTFAPPTLFDASTDGKKGGDLLLIKKEKDRDYEPISLIDVTVRSKSRKMLHSATHNGLGEDAILPVIVVNMTNIDWADIFGKTRETRRFLQSTARRLFRAHVTDYPLYGVRPEAVEELLLAMQSRIEAGCRRSSEHISQRDIPNPTQVLSHIDITKGVLGKKTNTIR